MTRSNPNWAQELALAFRLAVRELRAGPRHFKIFLAVLVLGLTTISLVMMVSRNMTLSLQENGRSILGGDMAVQQIYKPHSENFRAFFEQKQARLSQTIDLRAMARNPQSDETTLVELKGIDAVYPLIGDIVTNPVNIISDLQRNPDHVLVDESLLQRLQLKMGDVLALGEKSYKIAGVILKEPDRASSGRFGLAPRVMMGTEALDASGLIQTGSMVYYDLRILFATPPDFETLKNEIKNNFPESEGFRIRTSDRANPQFENSIGRLSLFLTLVGLSGLLVGGIGLSNACRHYFATRLKTIAMLKSIGTDLSLIHKIYLLQILMVTFCAILLSIFLSFAAVLGLHPVLNHYLPFPLEAHIVPQDVLVVAGFGILTTLIFCLSPLAQALQTPASSLFQSGLVYLSSRIDPKTIFLSTLALVALTALILLTSTNPIFSLFFMMAAFFIYAFFALWGSVLILLSKKLVLYKYIEKFLSLRFALKNLHRPNNLTLITVLSLGLGLTILVSVSLIENNFRSMLTQNKPEDMPSFFFIDIQKDQQQNFSALVQSIPSAQYLRLSPNIRGRLIRVNTIDAETALKDPSESWLLNNDRGLTFASEIPAHSEILDGVWWPENYSGKPLVSIVEDVAKAFEVGVGDELTISVLGREITAEIANIRSVEWTNFTISFALTFSPNVLENVPFTYLATIQTDPAQELFLQKQVAEQFPNITVIRLSEAIETATSFLRQIGLVVQITAVISLLMGVLVLMGAMAASQARRSYETVLLKVIGADPKFLIRIFSLEFFIIALGTALLACILGSLSAYLVIRFVLDISFYWNWTPIFVTLILGLVALAAVGLWGLTQSLRQAPLQYLRND
jgi:putative ABC transport system permease protein